MRPDNDESLRASDRVKRRADFRAIQSQGRKIHTPHFILAVLVRAPSAEAAGTASEAVARLGITVTRKIAGAVGRNRVKRVMREVFRRNRRLFPSGCDVVAIAKAGAHELGYHEVLAELEGAHAALARCAPRSPRTARGPEGRA